MKVRDAIKLIEADGWYLIKTRGSHKQFKHHTKPGRVTIAGHFNDDRTFRTSFIKHSIFLVLTDYVVLKN
ncbi:MAG: type II toxin-antitoxin system HicA family toxin [ANME-2 cluster archaeon]|nr:type II toxin-antitoxin system HicA family toxin [ANME-2 cluster archaeon]